MEKQQVSYGIMILRKGREHLKMQFSDQHRAVKPKCYFNQTKMTIFNLVDKYISTSLICYFTMFNSTELVADFSTLSHF